MTTTPSGPDGISAAWAELRSTMTNARTALDRVRSRPVHTPEERDQLGRDAASGALGREMQELAQRIERRETSWAEVFEGTSPYAALLHEHLGTMATEYRQVIAEAIEDDEEFDPFAPDPEV
jgi:hypothetical protein